jgi:HD-like signal output (HDOD) protein
MTQNKAEDTRGFALIVQQEGSAQQTLSRFLNLMLNYQCGLSLRIVNEVEEAIEVAQRDRSGVRCVFVVQNFELTRLDVIRDLGDSGSLPIFLVLPQLRVDAQRDIVKDCVNVHLCSWEGAFLDADHSLQRIACAALEQCGVDTIFSDSKDVPYPVLQQRVEHRLRDLNTLPTLPEIVMRIMRLINDPDTTTAELERLLSSDPAIVMKLLKVVRSPIFAGIGRSTDEWSLTDAIVRLGYKKVGGIAQQIKIINSFVSPRENEFDLRRFWEHSVGSALIADRLYTKRMIDIDEKIDFSEYWIGALLHDIGKLVLGFFFWDWFLRVVRECERRQSSFREIESKMGDVASHERVGQLLIMNAKLGEPLAFAVGNHHRPGEHPSGLSCIIHMANNLCKDLGMGYLEGDKAVYDTGVLTYLGLSSADVAKLRAELAEDICDEVKSLVSLCL